ncbi:hypothetical protein ACIHCV_18935 [Streptomyces sp. NPDC051956]|uniref:hypothetical protein n=1 Tax=Streptomyces sp. NPDC051956 TaxID=3365677 RepID=UPI0037D6817A
MQHVERQYGDKAVGLFLVGACSDQSPAFVSKHYTIDKDRNWPQTDAKDDGWLLLLTMQGERLGTEVTRVSESLATASVDGAAATPLRLLTDSVGHSALPAPHNDNPAGSDASPTDSRSMRTGQARQRTHFRMNTIKNGVTSYGAQAYGPCRRHGSRSRRAARRSDGLPELGEQQQ